MQQPKIILSHESFNSVGSWAITPILASISEHNDAVVGVTTEATNAATVVTGNNVADANKSTSFGALTSAATKWLIVCEDQSIVDIKALINNLKHENSSQVSLFSFFFFCRSAWVNRFEIDKRRNCFDWLFSWFARQRINQRKLRIKSIQIVLFPFRFFAGIISRISTPWCRCDYRSSFCLLRRSDMVCLSIVSCRRCHFNSTAAKVSFSLESRSFVNHFQWVHDGAQLLISNALCTRRAFAVVAHTKFMWHCSGRQRAFHSCGNAVFASLISVAHDDVHCIGGQH